MNDIAIRVENLSKQYRIGARQDAHPTLRDTLAGTFTGPYRRIRRLLQGSGGAVTEADRTIWALKDVSFEIKHGEVVGVIGSNGAGKTTLLKILSRITEPAEGYAKIRGRVGSLLEVGTGFHPELTGRENIYLNGAILGMKREEINRRFDEIVDFASIDKFLDTPVKHYSSGMYVRLAFAVAAHLETEVLLVDEVLAVGDAAFQKKCLRKMGEAAQEGRTILFISHNMTAVRNLCTRALLLREGHLASDGAVDDVIFQYLKTHDTAEKLAREWHDINSAPGNDKIRINSVSLVSHEGKQDAVLSLSNPIQIEVAFWNMQPDATIIINLAIYSIDDTLIFVSLTSDSPEWDAGKNNKGLYKYTCEIPGFLLNSGTYRIRLLFLNELVEHLYDFESAITFSVYDIENRNIQWYKKRKGLIRPRLKWRTKYVSPLII
jgi:lipopolysaccharide transport system ATP-binding protein